MRNLRLAFRTLFKAPFVTVVAIVSLALGIGANAAIFSMFDQILLSPLPVAEPGRLVNFSAPGPAYGSTSCNTAGDCDAIFSYPMFRDLQRESTAFSGIAAHRSFGANLAYKGQTLSAEGMLVSGSYFPVLGLRPALGRLLGPADDQTIGGHPVAVLSYDYWTARLGSDPDVLNQTIIVNGHPMTVVGVAPRGFRGTTMGVEPRVFVPITMRGQVSPGFEGFENRRNYWAYLFGRLKPGVSVEQAKRAINGVYRPVINDVEAPLQEGMSPQTLARFRAKEILLEPGPRGQSLVHRDARVPLILLFAITGFVLLIACANIANLLLARGANRTTEMAVRLSLGASRRQVLAQLLTESLLLAVLGGIAGLLVATWTLAVIASMLPAEVTSSLDLGLRPAAIAFAAVLSVGTGLLSGMFPALQSTRTDLLSTIRANATQMTGTRAAARFRTILVTAQIALSMALLISAGLFLKSLANISRVELGVQVQDVVTFGVSPELNGYDTHRARALFERLEEELAAMPGATGVAASLIPILADNNWSNDVSVEGFERGPDIDANASLNVVSAGYFRTLGVPLLTGREFTPADNQGAPKVAIVNEAFANKFNLGRDAVGKYMAVGGKDSLDIQIVGMVPNTKYNNVKGDTRPLYFTPYRQEPRLGALSFYVRTAGSPQQLMRSIPGVVARLDPNLPVERIKTMPQQVRENVFMDRMISTLSAAFAVLATILAAVGLYGVLAYSVAQRTREIGVRMALGADRGHVRRMVLGQMTRMVLIGGLIGIAAAFLLGRAAQSLLFELRGSDPVVFVVSAGLLALVAFGAAYIPALRASRVNPMQALRYE